MPSKVGLHDVEDYLRIGRLEWGDGCQDARDEGRSKMTGKINEEMRQAKSHSSW
jgi:hypothetical protein